MSWTWAAPRLVGAELLLKLSEVLGDCDGGVGILREGLQDGELGPVAGRREASRLATGASRRGAGPAARARGAWAGACAKEKVTHADGVARTRSLIGSPPALRVAIAVVGGWGATQAL